MRGEKDYSNGLFQIVKGVGAALVLSLLWTIFFAGILRVSKISDKVIFPINQTVKVLAISIGTLLFVRGEKGFLKGIGIGVLFCMLSYLTFSAIGGDFSLSWLIVVELALSAFVGVISGAIAVNLKKSG